MKKKKRSWASSLLLVFITFYRKFISPLMRPSCRFRPTCSLYALQAIEKHGALKGACLTVKRIFRCHPFSAGGDDPVP